MTAVHATKTGLVQKCKKCGHGKHDEVNIEEGRAIVCMNANTRFATWADCEPFFLAKAVIRVVVYADFTEKSIPE